MTRGECTQQLSTALVLVCNEAYANHAYILVRSAKKNEPTLYPIVFGINLSQSAKCRLINCGAELRSEFHVFESKEIERSFAANRRMEALREVLAEGYERVLYCDADSIIRRPLKIVWELLDECDLALCHFYRIKPISRADFQRMKYLSGVIALRNNPKVNHVVSRWSQDAQAHMNEWFADQIYLIKALDDARGLRIGSLPLSCIDWTYAFGSPLWVAKGARGKLSLIFRLEVLKYKIEAPPFLIGVTITMLQGICRLGEFLWRPITRPRTWLHSLTRIRIKKIEGHQ